MSIKHNKKEELEIEDSRRQIEKSQEEMDLVFKSIDKSMDSIKNKASDGSRDILRYFDRIHDKLFSFNNILIVGFFAIAELKENVVTFLIIVPLANLFILIYIDYKLMQKSRIESDLFTDNSIAPKHIEFINKANLYSLISMFTTLIVTCTFVYLLQK